MGTKKQFADWLEQRYLAWQHQQGKRATLSQFAEWLGISSPLLSHYMNGLRSPSRENIDKLANRLGPDIYGILGLQQPDAKLQFISSNWGKLTEEERHYLINKMEEYLGSKRKKNNGDDPIPGDALQNS